MRGLVCVLMPFGISVQLYPTDGYGQRTSNPLAPENRRRVDRISDCYRKQLVILKLAPLRDVATLNKELRRSLFGFQLAVAGELPLVAGTCP